MPVTLFTFNCGPTTYIVCSHPEYRDREVFLINPTSFNTFKAKGIVTTDGVAYKLMVDKMTEKAKVGTFYHLKPKNREEKQKKIRNSVHETYLFCDTQTGIDLIKAKEKIENENEGLYSESEESEQEVIETPEVPENIRIVKKKVQKKWPVGRTALAVLTVIVAFLIANYTVISMAVDFFH